MSRRVHHRSRSSVDRVLELLTELNEEQMQILLREAESTVSGNIPVSKGIDYFSRHPSSLLPTPSHPAPPPPRRKFLTSLSPRKQSELRRRLSKRASVHQQQDPAAAAAAGGDSSDSPRQNTSGNNKKTPRSYKRISRPIFSLPMPAATADLTELLAAYLTDAAPLSPSSTSSASTISSPATPRSPFSAFNAQPEWEDEGPVLDLLEPSPSRAPKPYGFGLLGSGGPVKGPVRKISGIFEVLDDALPAGFHH